MNAKGRRVRRPHIRVLTTGVALLACVLPVGLSAGADQDPMTYIFDTGKPGAPDATALASRAGWARLDEDNLAHAFKGAAVLVNNRLALVLRPSARSVEAYSLGVSPPKKLADLSPAGLENAVLASVKLVENTLGGVQATARFEGGLAFGIRLVPGDAIVELTHSAKLDAVRIGADIRYVTVPNYFGNDWVFTPRSLPDAAFVLAMEQFYLAMLGDGNTVMVAVCESGEQQARVLLAGSGDRRTIAATAVQVPPGRKVSVAFMETPGTWTVIPAATAMTDWTPPFEAHWRMNFIHENGQAFSRPWEDPEAEDHGALFATCCPRPMFSGSDTPVFLLPERLVYPLERSRVTPLDVFCVRDIMQNTMGVGPCEYIIAAEGLNDATPHKVAEWTRQLFRRKRAEKSADQIRERFRQMREHVEHSQRRIGAYANLAAQAAARMEKQKNAEGAEAFAQLIQILDDGIEIRQSPEEVAIEAGAWADGIVALIGKDDYEEAFDRWAGHLDDLGERQDRSLANSRMAAQWLKLRAGILGARYPEWKEFADTLAREAEALLKGRTSKKKGEQ